MPAASHQRSDIHAGVDLGIGAMLEQQAHHLDVGDFRRK